MPLSWRHIPAYEKTYLTNVGSEFAGGTLLDFYAKRFKFKPRVEWEAIIRSGVSAVNGVRATPETVLAATDLIATYRSEVIEPPVNDAIQILYQDDGLMILNKPAPLPIHPSGRFEKNSLISILRERNVAGPGSATNTDTGVAIATLDANTGTTATVQSYHPIYRLDAWTTGVFLMATDPDRARFLHRQVEKKRMRKVYAVLAVGEFGEAPFTIDAPIGRGPDGRRATGSELEHSKPCVTRFTPLMQARYRPVATCGTVRVPIDARPITLLKACPLTGRTNQIRVHVQAAGGYVLNDPLYSPMFTPEAWEEIPFLGLHCRTMAFALSPERPDFQISAPWPEGFVQYFQEKELNGLFSD